ncbi:MAG: ATP-binding protein [Bacteroidia bacterium]
MNSIVGRKKEIKQLDKVLSSHKSEFVAIYGRRRVGKTFLVREYFQYRFDFQLTGLANATTEQQLTNFHTALVRQSPNYEKEVPQNWFTAFQYLIDHLEEIKEDRKKIIFLDELPWIDTKDSDFIMSLEHFWNSWATARKDIILITCGSAASWMINELINNHGGLHNRVTERIKIYPFNLHETESMLKSRNHVLDRYQILQLYMVMGGIPFIWMQFLQKKSAAQNIEDLCFQKGALFVLEFPNLFASLFKNASRYETIVTALSSKTMGLTRKEIIQTTGLPSGGRLTEMLTELEESGFITPYTPYGGKSKTEPTAYQIFTAYSTSNSLKTTQTTRKESGQTR